NSPLSQVAAVQYTVICALLCTTELWTCCSSLYFRCHLHSATLIADRSQKCVLVVDALTLDQVSSGKFGHFLEKAAMLSYCVWSLLQQTRLSKVFLAVNKARMCCCVRDSRLRRAQSRINDRATDNGAGVGQRQSAGRVSAAAVRRLTGWHQQRAAIRV